MPRPSPRTRTWRPDRIVDVHRTLGSLRRGTGDPAYRITPDGAVWRAVRTPEGPATLCVGARRRDGVVEASAWGSGAGWLLDSVPALLGEDDDPAGFVPRHPLVRAAAARFAGWRVGRSGLVIEALVPAVLEQKVTGAEARRSWRELLRRFGDPAPGPTPDRTSPDGTSPDGTSPDGTSPDGMRVPPAAEVWAQLPSWEWHRAGVDGRRSRTVVAAARAAARLEETVHLSYEEAERRLRAVPGVGAWTAAEVRQRAHGDPDAVSVGDFHLPALVGYALTGHRVDDDGMLALLAPYAGHRYRAARLIEMSGVRVPRFGPRLPIRDHRWH